MAKKLLVLTVLLSLLLAPAAAAGEAPALSLSCRSAILMEKETGTVLYEQDAHTRRPPASVTKIMTMLLVMEALEAGTISMDTPVTVSAAAAGMGGSQVYLKQGEQFPLRDMLKCVAVASANDCAVALAEHLSGSEGAFVQSMNRRAAELGMADTTFVNCTGLPADGHLTSAYDIALMSRQLILHHPDIRDFTTLWTDSIREGAFGLTNTNRLIRFYPGATGLKTGSTDEALYCISATAEREGMELIAVVLKATTTLQRFQDAQALLDYGFARWALLEVHPDQALPPIDVLLGREKQVQPVLPAPSRLLVEKEARGEVSTRLTLCGSVQAPVDQSQILGKLEVFVGDELRDTVPIVADAPVARLTTLDVLKQFMKELFMSK